MRKSLVAALLFLASCHLGRPGSGPGTATLTGSPVPSPGSRLDGTRWLAHDAEIATSLGAGPLEVAVTEVGGDGDRVGGFVNLPSDQCVLAYARGSQGIEDLDLYAYADDGTILAADEATDPQPAVVICPPHPARAYVAARIVAGRGIVAIGVHPLAPSVAAQVGRALGARGRPGEEIGRIEAWPGLDDKVSQHRRAVGARWEELRRVAVQADARAPTRISASLDGGRCLDVYVVPSEEFSQLDLAVLDGDDRVLARAPAVGRDRTVIICSPVQTALSIELRPHMGQGLCAIVLARSALGAEREIAGAFYAARIAPQADLPAERVQRSKPLRALGYGDAAMIGTGTADVGRRVSFPITLPDGCTRIDVIGGRPIAGVTADVWDASSNLVTSGTAGDGPTLFACGKSGKGRIDVEALSRPGPFAIEVRHERSAPANLVAHPVAAGRMLSALNAKTDPVSARAADDAKVMTLDATSLKTFDFVLADGRCSDVVVTLDAGGAGVDMRLVDGQSGEELSSARGRLLAEARICATGHARNLRAELHLGAGKADALVVARPSGPAPP